MKIKDFVRSIPEEIEYFFHQSRIRSWKIWNNYSTIKVFLRFAETIITLFAGEFASDLIKDIRNSAIKLSSWQSFTKHWPLLLTLVLLMVFFLLEQKLSTRSKGTKRLTDIIELLFQDLETRYYPDFDKIRCTIWSPMKSQKPLNKMKIIQLIDYYPPVSGEKPINIHKKAGRIMKVTRKINGEDQPIGVVGQAINEIHGSTKRNGPVPIKREYTENYRSFEDLMKELNFTNSEINRMMPRESYMAIPITNSYKDDVLAVLYFDSPIKNEFNSDFVEVVLFYYIQLGKIMVDIA